MRHIIDRRLGKIRPDEPGFRTYRGWCIQCHGVVPLHDGHNQKAIWCRPCLCRMKTECPNCGVQPGETHGFPDCPGQETGLSPEAEAMLRDAFKCDLESLPFQMARKYGLDTRKFCSPEWCGCQWKVSVG